MFVSKAVRPVAPVGCRPPEESQKKARVNLGALRLAPGRPRFAAPTASSRARAKQPRDADVELAAKERGEALVLRIGETELRS